MRRNGMDGAVMDESAGDTWSAGWWLLAGLVLVSLVNGGCARARADASTRPGGAAVAARTVNVTTAPAARRTFHERITVQGNLDSRQRAEVGPKVPGTLAAVFVDEGDRVVVGETPLFRVDDIKLTQVVEAQRLELALAKTGIRQAQAQQEQAAANLKKAKRDFERNEALHTTRAVSADLLERAETGYALARAAHKQAKVLVRLARDRKRQAEVALAMAKQDLADATVIAPVSGVVTRRMLEPGETAVAGPGGRPVVRIDDQSVVEVSGFLPANVYPRVRAGETAMGVVVYGVDQGVVPISYKSPTIEATTRTFEVRCLLDNPDGAVAPGAMAEITVTLSERPQVGVPERAVVERAGASYVFVVDGDPRGGGARARMVPVETGLEEDGWVAVTGEGVADGTPIVTVGQSMLEDGAPVRLTGPETDTLATP